MKNKPLKILTYILGCLPLIAVAILFNRLPAEIPLHWNLDGTVDYSSKNTIWVLSSIALLLPIALNITPKIDPRGDNYKRFGKYYDGFCFIIVLVFVALNAITLSEALFPGKLSVVSIIIVMIGIVFVYIGNMMPKVKNNFTFGLKTPWTLADPDVWNKTHRLGGRLFFIIGALMIISGLFLKDTITFFITVVGTISIVIIPIIMSYIWYTKLKASK